MEQSFQAKDSCQRSKAVIFVRKQREFSLPAILEKISSEINSDLIV